MFRDREAVRRRINELVERFRQKGAISPEKALTLQELELPPRFEEAMHRRLGQSGIFVEVDGRYYLNEERLRQIQEQRVKGGFESPRSARPPTWFRIVGLLLILPMGVIVVLVVFYLLASSGGAYYPGELLTIFLLVFVALLIARLLFRSYRRRYWH